MGIEVIRRTAGVQRLLARSELLALAFGLRAPEHDAVRLTQRRIYILPSAFGLVFALALLLMLVGAINYGLSLGYVLTFALAGMGLASMLHAHRNLAGLVIRAGRVDSAVAGEAVVFRVEVENPGTVDRFSVVVKRGHVAGVRDLPAGCAETVELAVTAPVRGVMPIGRITLETRYPLGLFRVWAYVSQDVNALVYPRPDDADLPDASPRPGSAEAIAAGAGIDDFAGLRPYHPGDSPRHVAWKAVERENTLLTKVFTGRGALELWLDWAACPAGFGVEQRLSRLCRWVLLADAAGYAYGLRLPGVEIAPAVGSAHRDLCLERLARFDASAPVF